MAENEENKSIIKYSSIYGLITYDSNSWDELDDFGEKQLMNSKITKIKIYSGKFKEKDAIIGISLTYKNLLNGEEKVFEHRGTEQFIDVKELVMGQGEYITDFHIRFPNESEYITQLGYTTNKKHSILVGTEEGEDKIISSNGGKNIVVGTFGHVKDKLDATGVLFIDRKEYFKRILFGIFMLKHLVKTDKKFKEEWDNKQNDLPLEFKYMWGVVNLPENPLFQILKFCV